MSVSQHTPTVKNWFSRGLFFNGASVGWSEEMNRGDEEEDLEEDFIDNDGFDVGRGSGVSS